MRAARVAPLLVLLLLAFTGSSYAALGAPNLTGPADGSTSQTPSVFTWQAVSGADHYVFQLGGASGFNPFQYAVDTKNTRVALLSALQAGDYTWRVAAVSSTGAQGAWSTVRGFTIDWSDTAAPQSPDRRRQHRLSRAAPPELGDRVRRAGVPPDRLDGCRPLDTGRRHPDHDRRERVCPHRAAA